MSQFAVMIPVQGSGATLKTSGDSASDPLQTAGEGDLEGRSFTQTLQELSESNPNAAALLLALQQVGIYSPTPLNLQPGGSTLPLSSDAGGKPLPFQQGQVLQLSSLQAVAADAPGLLEAQQLQPVVPSKLLPADSMQLLAAVADLAQEGSQQLDSKGLSDFSTQLQGLVQSGQNAPAAGTVRPGIALPVPVPVGQPGWDNAVGERIQWMMSRNVQQAEIRLTPPDLGPMEIRISLHSDQTSVNFIAPHAATRDALEAAIPRLREIFGEINLNLANVDVSQRQAGGSGDGNGSSAGSDRHYGEGTGELSLEPNLSVTRLQSRGVLDTYA